MAIFAFSFSSSAALALASSAALALASYSSLAFLIISEIILQISPIDLSESSLPGIGYSTKSGSEFVSTNATIGIFNFLASANAKCSRFISTTNNAPGFLSIFEIPVRFFSNLKSSLLIVETSFFGNFDNEPSSSIFLSSLILDTELLIVSLFVSIPPNHL